VDFCLIRFAVHAECEVARAKESRPFGHSGGKSIYHPLQALSPLGSVNSKGRARDTADATAIVCKNQINIHRGSCRIRLEGSPMIDEGAWRACLGRRRGEICVELKNEKRIVDVTTT
jgi:hypothetical protein